MAKIIENINGGRRKILLSSYDIISIVNLYQDIKKNIKSYEEMMEFLRKNDFYLPEDF